MKKIVSVVLVLFLLISFAACGSGNDAKTYTFTIMFLADGNIVQRANYSVGDTISAPSNVVKEGYTFMGWAEEVPLKMPARDLYINAVFEKNTYKVSYYVNDILVHEDEVLYGAAVPAYSVSPDISESFSGWDAELPETMPAHDIELHGQSNADTYLLTFTVNGSVYKADLYREGEKVKAPEAPEVEGYTFEGWDEIPEVMPGSNVTVPARLSAKQYRITYLSGEGGIVIASETVAFGTDLTGSSSLVTDPPEGKVFVRWENMPETMPAHDISVYPVWADAEAEYTISYFVNKTLYTTQKYTAGAKVTAPEDPDIDGFAGWIGLPDIMPEEDVAVEAKFIVPYLLAFYAEEDVLYASMQLTEGTPLSVFIPKAPQKSGYRFTGWDIEIPETMPAHDLKLTATWEKEGHSLKIYDADPAQGGKLISSTTLEAGSAITYPDLTKEGYTLTAWNEDADNMPDRDLVLYPVWEANTYTLTYVSSLDEAVSVDCRYGEAISPLVPADHYGYSFGGWVGMPETMPAHNVTVVAAWTEIVPDPVTVMVDLSALSDGETYTIVAGGVYTLSGLNSNARIVIDSRYDVTLKLKNTYLTCTEGNVIECVSAASLTIQALPSSVSSITAENGGIYSAADLFIVGNGTVTLNTKTGIIVKGDLTFDANMSYISLTSGAAGVSADGSINVISGRINVEAADTAISSGSDLTIESGEVFASSEKAAGIVIPGSAVINGGKLMRTSEGDGLTAGRFVQNGGTVEITSNAVGIRSQNEAKVVNSGLTVYSGSIGVFALTSFEAIDSDVYLIAGGSAVLPPSYDASGNRIPTIAVRANTVSVEGGRFEATATQYAFDTYTFGARDAVLKLTTSEDAIFVGESAAFSNCDVTIRAGMSFRNTSSALTRGGITAPGSVTFNGGNADISSAGNCISAKSLTAMGTGFTFTTDATAIAVSEKVLLGACTVKTDGSDYGITAGEVEFRSTDAEITSKNNAVLTAKSSVCDGSVTLTGSEVKLCSSVSALSSAGGVNIGSGLLLMFSQSSTLPASVYSGELSVTDGTFAEFGMSDKTYENGLSCILTNTVKKNNLIAISGVYDFLIALYADYPVRNIHIVSTTMNAGYTYDVLVGGKYVGTDTYKLLTGGTYTPGTVTATVVYK